MLLLELNGMAKMCFLVKIQHPCMIYIIYIIYLHFYPEKSANHVGKYISPMDPMGLGIENLWNPWFLLLNIKWGNDAIGLAYFSNGLVQPPTSNSPDLHFGRSHFSTAPQPPLCPKKTLHLRGWLKSVRGCRGQNLKGFLGMPRNPSLSKTGSKKHRAAGLETWRGCFFRQILVLHAAVVVLCRIFTRRWIATCTTIAMSTTLWVLGGAIWRQGFEHVFSDPKWGAQEPQNPQNRRVFVNVHAPFVCVWFFVLFLKENMVGTKFGSMRFRLKRQRLLLPPSVGCCLLLWLQNSKLQNTNSIKNAREILSDYMNQTKRRRNKEEHGWKKTDEWRWHLHALSTENQGIFHFLPCQEIPRGSHVHIMKIMIMFVSADSRCVPRKSLWS